MKITETITPDGQNEEHGGHGITRYDDGTEMYWQHDGGRDLDYKFNRDLTDDEIATAIEEFQCDSEHNRPEPMRTVEEVKWRMKFYGETMAQAWNRLRP